MNTNSPTPRIPKLGDIVQYGVEPTGAVWGASQPPPTPSPAIILAVHDPGNPESPVDLTVFGRFMSGVIVQSSVAYSPMLGIGTWSWID
jgi:hypothetical protein